MLTLMACAIVPPPYTYWGYLLTLTGASDFAFHSGSLSILKQKLPSWCSSSAVLPSASASLTPFKFFCCSIACCPLHTSPHAGLTESPKCDLNFSVLTPEHPYSHNFQSLKLCSAESLFLFGWSALDHTVDGFRSLSPCLECVHAYMYVSTCTWRSEADIGCLSWLFLHIIIVIDYMFFWDKISYWTSSSSICPDWLASKPLFHSPHLCADVTGAAGFLCGFKGWHSGFYACPANTVPTELSLPALCPGFVLCNDLL